MFDLRCRLLNARTMVGLIGLAAAICSSGATASAAQTTQYDQFSACPTTSPLMNNPTYEFALCGSGTVQSGSFTIGDLTIPFSAPVNAQFAGVSPNLELEDCSPLTCIPVVPGSTTLEMEPIQVRVPALHGPGDDWSDGVYRSRNVHASHDFHRSETISIRLESTGDIRHIALDAIFGAPVPGYELPVKLHLSGRFLGHGCFVGSDTEPIVLAPVQTQQATSFEFLADPNGFEVEMLKIIGAEAADDSFAVPTAHGCGPRIRSHRRTIIYALDERIDELFGLPSASGQNEAVFHGSDLALVVAGYDGTPPDGGATLQAAFEAAR